MSELLDQLRAQGGLIGAAVREPETPSEPAEAAAARGPDYAYLVEAIHEGYLAHYGRPRLLSTTDDDLALLAGDHLYATGLARLAELGDLAGVRVLADLISRCAQAHAEGRVDDAAAAWRSGVEEITRGA